MSIRTLFALRKIAADNPGLVNGKPKYPGVGRGSAIGGLLGGRAFDLRRFNRPDNPPSSDLAHLWKGVMDGTFTRALNPFNKNPYPDPAIYSKDYYRSNNPLRWIYGRLRDAI